MPDFSLVPVDHQPDFSDVSFVPVDHDPFGVDGTTQQADTQPQPESRLQQPTTGIGQPNAPIPPAGTPALANQPQPDGREPASGGDSSSVGKSLLRATINAAVPGAYHFDLAQQQFRQGNYGAAALYGAESLADAALGVATLGASTRLGTAARAARTIVPATVETAGGNVTYKLETYLLDPNHVSGGPKARWFEQALGYTRENMADLAKQLVFDETKAIQTKVTPYGTHFDQIINVTGANGRTIPVTTGWKIGPDGVPRLVTALPRSK